MTGRRAARALGAGATAAAAILAVGRLAERGADRVLSAPRRAPGEEALRPALDALGGEIVSLRSRDGLRLSARWVPAGAADDEWRPDPREAVLLVHGWSGSVAPDLVEFGPFLRRTANVLGLDLRGHGDSDAGPASFGLREVDDVGGGLAWLGERGIRRVALMGSSMGAIVALAALAVLGDGTLAAADAEPDPPSEPRPAPRPRVVAAVAESVPASISTVVANRIDRRIPAVLRRWLAGRILAAAARRLGGDPRDTEPLRVMPLVAPVPVLLVHGTADDLVPVADGELLAAASATAERFVVPGAAHSRGHAADPAAYEARVTGFLRRSLIDGRGDRDGRGDPDDAGILAAARPPSTAPGAPGAD